MELKNKRIFITGGCGFLGKALIKDLYKDNEITVYSRDEAKHYYVKKQYPKVNFVIGDIRNLDLMQRAAKRYNCNVGIFAASLKQIEACDENPEEAIYTIALGAVNSRKVAEDCVFESAIFCSTDKATSPNLIYGALKLAGDLNHEEFRYTLDYKPLFLMGQIQ
jgi:UDP-N-acetylglucosamine 4,6-dehydratase